MWLYSLCLLYYLLYCYSFTRYELVSTITSDSDFLSHTHNTHYTHTRYRSLFLLLAHQDAVELRKVKLDYYEVTPCLDDVSAKWEDLLLTTPATKPIDLLHLNTSVRAGRFTSQAGIDHLITWCMCYGMCDEWFV